MNESLSLVADTAAARRRAILLLLVAMVCVAAVDTIAKLLSAEIPVVQIVWARFFFIFLCFSPFFARRGATRLVQSGNVRLQLVRASLQIVTSFSFFGALAFLPLADVVAIAFASPLFMILLAAPILGERPGLRRWAAVLVGLGGVLVMVRPGFADTHWAMALPVVAALSFALFQLLTRILARTDESLTTLFYSTVVGTVIMTAAVPTVWVDPSPGAWVMMAGLGVIGAIAHALMIEAFSTAPASSLAPFTYSEIVWAALLGLFVFGELPDPWVAAGAAIVVASGIYAYTLERSGTP